MNGQNSFATYQEQALRTEKRLPEPLDRLAHAALGLITESGELATEIKRAVIYGKPLDDARKASIAEEIGDVLWYMAIVSDTAGISFFRDDMPDRAIYQRRGALHELRTEAINLSASVGDFGHCLLDPLLLGTKVDMARASSLLEWIALPLLNIAHALGLSIDQIAAENIGKLRARYPEAYSDEAAEARADKGGLDARHS